MKRKEKARILSQECLSPGIYSMWVETGMAEEAAPGQFVSLYSADGSRLLPRPISLCEIEEGRIRLVYRVAGAGTEEFSSRKAGDTIEVLGPLGNGFPLKEAEGKKAFLIGGGIGVPPIVGCRHSQEDVAVVGFRSIDRVMPALIDKLEDTCASVYLCTDDGTLGRHGFVDGQVRDILAKGKSFTAVLACGPRPMLNSVAKAAAEFVVPCQVSMEERMACGVGACLGCAIQMKDGTMKHVCKDGPVFNAEEVAWDV